MSEPDDAPDGPSASAGQSQAGAAARLDAWRATGAHRVDPVRFGFIEALARRAQAQQGPARRILDAKLDALLAAYADAVEKSQAAAAKTPPPSHAAQAGRATAPSIPAAARAASEPRNLAHPQATVARPPPSSPRQPPPAVAQAASTATLLSPPRRGVLATLIDEVDRRHAAAPRDGDAHTTAASHGLPSSRPVELKSVSEFKATWSRLSADRRLNQSLMAKAPGNAGPLNSQHLVHRSLRLMRELSPAYLRQFMAYADALAWIEDSQDAGGGGMPAAPTAAAAAAGPAPAARRQEGAVGKKPARGAKNG